MQKLPVIEVHQDCFSAAGCHPEGELCQIRLIEIRVVWNSCGFLCISCFNKILKVLSQLFLMIEKPVQKKLCKEKCNMLEIAERQRLGKALVEINQMTADISVIPLKIIP